MNVQAITGKSRLKSQKAAQIRPAPTKTEPNVKKKNGRKICIFGNFGSTNFGNEITLQTILIQLGGRLPDAEVVCICMGPEALAATQKIEAVPISRNFIKPWKPRTRLALLLKTGFHWGAE